MDEVDVEMHGYLMLDSKWMNGKKGRKKKLYKNFQEMDEMNIETRQTSCTYMQRLWT